MNGEAMTPSSLPLTARARTRPGQIGVKCPRSGSMNSPKNQVSKARKQSPSRRNWANSSRALHRASRHPPPRSCARRTRRRAARRPARSHQGPQRPPRPHRRRPAHPRPENSAARVRPRASRSRRPRHLLPAVRHPPQRAIARNAGSQARRRSSSCRRGDAQHDRSCCPAAPSPAAPVAATAATRLRLRLPTPATTAMPAASAATAPAPELRHRRRRPLLRLPVKRRRLARVGPRPPVPARRLVLGDTGRSTRRPSSPSPGSGARPGPSQPGKRPGAPRPGNNPFSSNQGMRPGGPRPGNNPFSSSQGMRPAEARSDSPAAAPGGPRPNPNMMPRTRRPAAPTTGRGARPGGGPGRGDRPGGGGAGGGARGGGYGGARTGAPLAPVVAADVPAHPAVAAVAADVPAAAVPAVRPGRWRLRSPRWSRRSIRRPPGAEEPEVQACEAPRVRQHGSTDDRWRQGRDGRRPHRSGCRAVRR